jgi:hypothetical protein
MPFHRTERDKGKRDKARTDREIERERETKEGWETRAKGRWREDRAWEMQRKGREGEIVREGYMKVSEARDRESEREREKP